MAIKIQGDTVIFDDKVFRVGQGTTAQRPASPQTGMVRFNTDMNSLEGYDGTEWGPIGGGGGAEVSATAPSDPDPGDLWWNSTTGILKIYYDDGTSQQWVDASPTLSNDFVEDVYVPPPPDTLGQAYGGGFYIGTTSVGATQYYLIVAPNATGCAQCQWKTTRTQQLAQLAAQMALATLMDRWTMLIIQLATGQPLEQLMALVIGICLLRDELNQLYVNDGGGTNTNLPAGEGFAAGFYWSSTEYSATFACSPVLPQRL
jgi:hypothetical protein